MADVRCNLPRGKATKRNSRWRERSVRIIEKQDLDQLRQVTIISLEKISVLYQSRDNEGYLSILYTLWRVGTRVILQYLLLDSIFNCFGITRVRVRRWFVRTDRCNYSQCFDDFRDATVEYNRVTLFGSRIYDCLYQLYIHLRFSISMRSNTIDFWIVELVQRQTILCTKNYNYRFKNIRDLVIYTKVT